MVDCGGRTLMPGLIDSHVHVFLSEVNIRFLEAVPLTLATARAVALMRGMIDRGFTTVRDTGGADWGIKSAVEQGHVPGPRLFIAGQAIGPTGGHSDPRRRTDFGARCHCCNAMAFTHGGVRRRRRGAQERPRADAPGRRPYEDHDVGRRCFPLRPARQSLQFSPAEVARRRRGGAGLRALRLRPRLHAGGNHPRRPCRRAHDRARQPHRRAGGEAHGREGHVS